MGVVKSISEKSFTCCIVVSSQWGGAPRSEGLRGLHSRETCDIPPALKKKGGYYKSQ